MNLCPAIINGCWQLASGHNLSSSYSIDFINLYFQHLKSGLNTFDCADIYCGVEEQLGRFRKKGMEQGYEVFIHTKYVPNKQNLSHLSLRLVEDSILSSCKKLAMNSLDLVQFHWWDYEQGDYMQALEYLDILRNKGLIKKIGLTNFNAHHLKNILNSGIPIHSIQTQYSFLDKRIEKNIIEIAQKNKIKIFAYGMLAGGFFSTEWLNKKEPDINELKNRSLIKYLLVIQDSFGWDRFQSLLLTLLSISTRLECTLSELVILYFIKYKKIDAVILGVSLNFRGNPLEKLKQVSLNETERMQIESFFDYSLFSEDVYDLERTSQKHASIMKYNLNKN